MSVERVGPAGATTRRALFGLLAGGLLVVGLGLLVGRLAGFSEVGEAVERADARWFGICVLGQLASFASYAAVQRLALRWRGGVEIGWGASALVMLASIGASRVVAAGGAAAIATAYWSFRRAGLAAGDALVRVLGFNLSFYAVFGAGTWLAAALGLAAGDALAVLTVTWLVVVPLVAAATLAASARPAAGRAPLSAGSWTRRALTLGEEAARWARDFLAGPAGLRALVASAWYWAGSVVCLWAALRSVGVPIGVSELVLAFATGHAATILPLPFGGLGGVDAALTSVLALCGVALAPALVAVAVYRFFSFWIPTLPALVALALLPRVARSLARPRAAPA